MGEATSVPFPARDLGAERPAAAPTLPRLWSVRSIADRFHISASLVRRLACKRRWRRYRIASGPDPARFPVRYDERDVEKIIIVEGRNE